MLVVGTHILPLYDGGRVIARDDNHNHTLAIGVRPVTELHHSVSLYREIAVRTILTLVILEIHILVILSVSLGGNHAATHAANPAPPIVRGTVCRSNHAIDDFFSFRVNAKVLATHLVILLEPVHHLGRTIIGIQITTESINKVPVALGLFEHLVVNIEPLDIIDGAACRAKHIVSSQIADLADFQFRKISLHADKQFVHFEHRSTVAIIFHGGPTLAEGKSCMGVIRTLRITADGSVALHLGLAHGELVGGGVVAGLGKELLLPHRVNDALHTRR